MDQYSAAAAAALVEGHSEPGGAVDVAEQPSLSLSVHGRRVEADLDLQEGGEKLHEASGAVTG
jgi:hypothetical protein